jgi:peptidoglycan-associated lipoprotein
VHLQTKWLSLISISLAVAVLTGCPPKKKMAIDEKAKPEVKVDTTTVTSTDLETQTPAPGDVQINQDWTEIPNLQVALFAYDAAGLDDAARAVLKNNVAIIKKLPTSVVVRIEGHCDDRGTVEYNIALGQRRANAVKAYYATAGISKSRLDTISFGEERPSCTQETDACWAQNRRGVTKVKNAQPLTIKADQLK